MKKFIISIITFAAVFANAAGIQSSRCEQFNDSLDAAQALDRIKWALKCYDIEGELEADGSFSIVDTATGAKSTGYPIIAEIMPDKSKKHVTAPLDPSAPCYDTKKFKIAGWCRAGCFTPDQYILMNAPGGFVQIKEGLEKEYTDMFLIDGLNGAGEMEFKRKNLVSYVVDDRDKHQQIMIFKTENGGELKVTTNHPLVNGEGYMVAAKTLKVGDALKTMENENDKIVSVETVDYFGKVYNIDMGSTDIYNNIIVANGFLSGTVYFQNDGVAHLNRMVLRTILPEEMTE